MNHGFVWCARRSPLPARFIAAATAALHYHTAPPHHHTHRVTHMQSGPELGGRGKIREVVNLYILPIQRDSGGKPRCIYGKILD